jgi:CRP/FNR family transcriptional activator FtrB
MQQPAKIAMATDRKDALRRIAAFSGLPRPVLARLAAFSGVQRVGKGSVLFRQGEPAHYVHGLVEGTVTLCGGSPDGEIVADFMAAGDLILVPPALLRLPYMVTALASSDLVVVMIPAEEFRRLAETEIDLAKALNRLMCGHWRLLLRHLIHAKTHNADTRLKNYLIDLAGKREGAARLVLPGSKKDLAAHLGVTPETLSRSLKRLAGLGVSTKGGEIQIKEMTRLVSES